MKRILPALMALSLSACALGPNFKTPPVPPKGAGAFVSSSSEITTPQAAPNDWWRLYNDPVLDKLIQQAFTANTDLRVAEANLGAERGVLDQAQAGLFPSTNLSAGASYGRRTTSSITSTVGPATGSGSTTGGSSSGTGTGTTGTGTAGTGTTGTGTGTTGTGTGTTGTGVGTTVSSTNSAVGVVSTHPQWLYNAAYDVSYEIDLFGAVRRSIEAARGDYQSTEAARDAVRITVAAETARAYADGCAFGEEVDAARRTMAILQDSYDIALKQRDAGASSDFDVARAAALLEQAQAAVPGLEGQRRAALFELAAVLGLTPSEVPPEAARCRVPPKIKTALPVGDGTGLLRRRPDVREAERHLAAETARIGVAEAAFFPTVSLAGSISTIGDQHSNLASNSNVSYGIGPLISWNFPNILAARGQLITAKSTAKAALASFDGTVLTALKEVEQALTTYNGELERNASLQRGLADSRRAFDLAKARYQAGSSSYLDLLTTEQTLVTAESSLAASDEALAADQVAVFKALGGGWQLTQS